jgi:uncharacterized protein (TIGR02246 family)
MEPNGEIAAADFVAGYGRTWQAWDVDGFLDLFTEDVVYVVHPTEETVEGRETLRVYFAKEEAEQGPVEVRMGEPLVDGDRVVAEFWVTSGEEAEEPMTIVGCLLAQIDPGSGRCPRFREYWFDLAGRIEPFPDWGT